MDTPSSVPPGLRGSRGRGFTIVEMMVAAFIALIVFGIGFAILNGATQARSNAQKRIRATDGARMFFEMVERDLNDAYPGPWAAPYSKADLIDTHGDYSGNALKMTLTGGHIKSTGGFVTVRYFVLTATHRLYREVTDPPDPAPGPPNLSNPPANQSDWALLPDVEAIQFDYYQWLEGTKSMSPAASEDATHINVMIKMMDSDGTQRTFNRLMAIPTSFSN